MKEKIDLSRVPQHIAVIMDGNGRWAKKRGAARVFGHRNAVKAVQEISEASAELGVKYLTLYAFSTENWNRPPEEVNALMQLLVHTIEKETPTLQKNNIRLMTIGNIQRLPAECIATLQKAINQTASNTGMTVILALSYSGRWEILNAVKAMAADIEAKKLTSAEIDDEKFNYYLNTYNIPDPELIIRTSGEMRISNFLLWQLAYSELFFTDILWPDFRKEHLYEAILSYQQRERRFGKISEQLLQP
ncbi:MAG: isoprenyl transferase [Cytophagales bacterium]|nr:isoprenyl transferase [Bernardetiaceae bacterium]MDW8204747.1 isoprenyl transferase [Cytophagales bacterium]